jgi:tripartite ATP-independent transporter DctM subunit
MACFIVVIMIMVWRNPELAPALPRVPMHERLVSLKTGLPIIIIFIVVIGGIYAGMFTATEGGGIGAFTTVFLALVMGRLSWSIVTSGLNDTGKTISMAFTVLGGAGVFSYFMTMSKIPMILAGVIASMNMPPMAVMFAIIVCMSLLGCFIPAIPLMLICVPIFLPLAALFGWNLIWFGVIINILVTMAGMTPPFGVSLFVAKELADVPLSLVYRSSIPFVLAFFLCLGFCIAFEPLSTWLPAMMR